MRTVLSRWVLGLVALLVLGACSSATTGTGSSPTLAGTYHLVGDVGGTQVKSGATVTMTLRKDGTLTVVAVQPGQRFTDSGTWKVTGDSIAIEFKDQQIKGTGKYEFDGKTLRLPVLIFGEGKGISEWQLAGASTSGAPTSSAPPVALPDHSDLWDLDHDAAAAGTKVYSDAVAKGTSRTAAIQEALTKVQGMPDVTDAGLSSNGLNIGITYSDGLTENIVTERLQPPTPGGNWHASSTALGSAAGTCETLPGQSADPREPGREGVNPGGGYGVALYDQNIQPKPVSSADSPPSKRALLIAPQYDVKHPLHKVPTSIREVSGDTIECLQASLKKVNYTVDTILGTVSGGKPINAGDQAIQQLITKLTTQKYGVIYFLGHGYLERTGNAFAGIWMGAVDLDRPEIKAVLNGKKIDRSLVAAVNEAYTKLFGFTWDPANPVFDFAPDDDLTPSIIVKPAFFAQLRAKGTDFSKTLIMIDACSSASTLNMVAAAGPKAYIGWKREMSGEFISNAGEAIFDMLTDKARTVRAAAQLWQIHEKWKATGPALEPGEDWINLVAVGANGKEYDKIDAQTYILIFRLRHGPSSATSNITQSTKVIRACYDQIWKSHKGALASPACHALDYGATQPTEGQVVEALFEVGVQTINGGGGRWTLAD
jgi:hypothetical protein